MSDQPLNPRQEQFARLYYAGPDELRGNGRRCYMEAYGVENPGSADAAASRLLRRDKVRARMRGLREEAAKAAKARARSWWELYPEAQDTLRQALTGDWADGMDAQDKRSAVEAAIEILSRCEGTARQVHEHHVHQQPIEVYVAGAPHPISGTKAAGADRRRLSADN